MKMNSKKAGIIAGSVMASPVVFVLGFVEFLITVFGYLAQALIWIGAILFAPFVFMHTFLKCRIDSRLGGK